MIDSEPSFLVEGSADTQSCSDDDESIRVFLKRNIGQCVFCKCTTSFKQHFYYCLSCKHYFKTLVEQATTLVCLNTEPSYRTECEHCVLDLFYTYGMKAEDVGIRRLSLTHAEYVIDESINQISDREYANEMEKLFVRQLDKSANDFLTWLNDQKVLTYIHPVDRMTLFRRNLGRGRLMWIICESAGIDNFLKLSDCYYNPWDATSTISRQIIKCLFEYAGKLSMGITNAHMLHMLKILSVLQIGPTIKTSPLIDAGENFVDVFYENMDKENIKLQRPCDIGLILENYWNMIENINPKYRTSLNELDEMLSYLTTFNSIIEYQFNQGYYPTYITTEELANRLMWKFKSEQSICVPNPPEIITFPRDRLCMIRVLNKFYVTGIEYARKLLKYYVVIKDQEILLAYNLKYLVIQQLSWHFEGRTPPFIRSDKICINIVWKLKYLYTLQSTMPFTRIPLLQMIILLMAPGAREENHPISILEKNYRKKLINIMKKEHEMSSTNPKLRLVNIMDIILNCSRYIENNIKHFPLLFDGHVLM